MFDLDRWREIFQSISKNKLRSVMSGFTISFAILLFTLLFGVVNGLSNTFKDAFVDDAQNSMFVRVGRTTKPYKGLQSGRVIQLKNENYDYVTKTYEDKIQYQTARIYKNVNITYNTKQDNYTSRAVHPDHQFLEKTIMDEGRYINTRDLKERAKVLVIGRLVKKDIFGEKPALGKRVNVNGISYKIIGIFSDDGGDNEERLTYMPVTTAQMLYGNNDYISEMNLGYNPSLSLDEAVDLVLFAFQHGVHGDLFIQKSPGSTVQDLATAIQELFNSKKEMSVIGKRHGEKMYETLATKEEVVFAEDLENYYRIPADNRDLNYNKYFVEGNQNNQSEEDYNSSNTKQLSVSQIKEKLLTLDYIKNELSSI